MAFTFRDVDDSTWPDLVALMEGRGGPKHCWCLVWREPHRVRRDLDLAGRRALMRERTESGTPIGILGYVEGEPAGWCSVAPRGSYVALGGPEDERDVWSIVCFFVPTRFRGQGLAEALLVEAIVTARSRGAEVIEAYPVDRESPSYRFMGFVPMFERAGFREIGRAGSRRHVMRLEATSTASSATPSGAPRSPRA
jgi:ribosomal protein S18 acetylase RimI-like enzyme